MLSSMMTFFHLFLVSLLLLHGAMLRFPGQLQRLCLHIRGIVGYQLLFTTRLVVISPLQRLNVCLSHLLSLLFLPLLPHLICPPLLLLFLLLSPCHPLLSSVPHLLPCLPPPPCPSPPVAPRCLTRTRSPPSRLGNFVISVAPVEDDFSNTPKTWKQLLQSPNKASWLQEDDGEFYSLIGMDTWRLVPLPLKRKVN